MAINTEFGPVYNLADWAEEQMTASIVYVGLAPDPTAAEPTNITLRPYGSVNRPSPGYAVQSFQAKARGVAAYQYADEFNRLATGLEATIDGVPMTVVPIQSAPVFITEEDTGGTQWVQNFNLEWKL